MVVVCWTVKMRPAKGGTWPGVCGGGWVSKWRVETVGRRWFRFLGFVGTVGWGDFGVRERGRERETTRQRENGHGGSFWVRVRKQVLGIEAEVRERERSRGRS